MPFDRLKCRAVRLRKSKSTSLKELVKYGVACISSKSFDFCQVLW